MTPELERAIKTHTQFFCSYKKSGELIKVRVWLTLNDGRIEFLTPADSFKAKRIRRNPKAVSFLGGVDGPSISGTAEIVTDEASLWRCYRAYGKTHRFMMLFLSRSIAGRIKTGGQVLIRMTPDEPNPLVGATDPALT